MATFRMTGLKQARAALRRLGPAARRVLPKAVHAAAEVLRAEVQSRVDVDTGFLRAHVRIEPARGTRPGVAAEEVVIARDDFEGRVFYGAAEEFGTSKMHGSGAMRASADAAGGKAADRAADVLKDRITRR